MKESFDQAMPYVFIQASTEGNDYSYLDAAGYLDETSRFRSSDPDELLRHLMNVPLKKLTFIVLVPWEKEGVFCGSIDKDSKSHLEMKGTLLACFGHSQTAWYRGILYGQALTGLGMPKDLKLAHFLFSRAKPWQKQASLDAALLHASHSMSPALIRCLLREGANPAPCIQSDEFLPLTVAAKAGQIETVKILLAAGADPRQSASWAHGTAIACSKKFTQIQEIFKDHLRGKNADVMLRPTLDGQWEEHSPSEYPGADYTGY